MARVAWGRPTSSHTARGMAWLHPIANAPSKRLAAIDRPRQLELAQVCRASAPKERQRSCKPCWGRGECCLDVSQGTLLWKSGLRCRKGCDKEERGRRWKAVLKVGRSLSACQNRHKYLVYGDLLESIGGFFCKKPSGSVRIGVWRKREKRNIFDFGGTSQVLIGSHWRPSVTSADGGAACSLS